MFFFFNKSIFTCDLRLPTREFVDIWDEQLAEEMDALEEDGRISPALPAFHLLKCMFVVVQKYPLLKHAVAFSFFAPPQ